MEAEIEKHVSKCSRCKHAKRIGALCRVGRAWFDDQIRTLLKTGVVLTENKGANEG